MSQPALKYIRSTPQQEGLMSNESVRVFHLRRRTNGIPEATGGYSVVVKARSDGRFNITIAQCNDKQRYDEKLGEKIAVTRMKQGKYFVQGWEDVVATMNTLHTKLCTGTVVVKLDLPTASQVRASNDAGQASLAA
jgi:hypothetical protein